MHGGRYCPPSCTCVMSWVSSLSNVAITCCVKVQSSTTSTRAERCKQALRVKLSAYCNDEGQSATYADRELQVLEFGEVQVRHVHHWDSGQVKVQTGRYLPHRGN